LKFHRLDAEIFVPGGGAPDEALGRCTHLGVGAHADDLEILSAHGIIECFGQIQSAYCGVVVTDGAGSARSGEFGHLSDDEMRAVRREEQRKAAALGGYSACVSLDYPSVQVKSPSRQELVLDLLQVLEIARPRVVYTHNLFDKHDTHVAVVCALLDALRGLEPNHRPEKVIACEVWGDLDWLVDSRKIVMDVSRHQQLQLELLSVFRSQIAGGKRYDLGTMGRRRAHATFSEFHQIDRGQGLIFGFDLMPLIVDPNLSVDQFMRALSEVSFEEARSRVRRLTAAPERG
jgi:LmbE family N-acetylglucosaminyl deacetylase